MMVTGIELRRFFNGEGYEVKSITDSDKQTNN